ADDANTGNIFLNFGGEGGKRGLNGFVQAVNDFSKIADGDEYNGNREENPESEGWRQTDKQANGEHHRGDGGGAGHDSRAKHHANSVEVVGSTRHQFAGAIADVELRV